MFLRGNVGLAHRRLSIIDLKSGNQPMVDSSQDVAIVYNGEIYNYLELRRDLTRSGFHFRTNSDTEVLLASYLKWGEQCVCRFNGMWAFAIADFRGNVPIVWCSRDRIGIKPLYYYIDEALLAFSSELKALRSLPDRTLDVDWHVMNDYLVLGPRPRGATWLKGVRELGPGSSIKFQGKTLSVTHYFSLADTFSSETTPRKADLFELVHDSVRMRLQADVPIATINSGGLDSSLVSALAHRSKPDLRTYSVAPTLAPNGDVLPGDESAEAERVAAWLGTSHRTIRYGPSEFLHEVDAVTRANDGEVFHSNSVPLFALFRNIRRDGYKVVLGGEGADEVFRGYYTERLLNLSNLTGVGVLDMILRLRGRNYTYLRDLGDGAVSFISNIRMSRFTPTDAERLTGVQFQLHEDRAILLQEVSRLDPASALAYYEQSAYLAGLLRRADRMSMAHGVELRVPYLDHRIVKVVNSILPKYKGGLWPHTEKKMLKELASKVLPGFVVKRRKYGFAAPIVSIPDELRTLAARTWGVRETIGLSAQQMWVLASALPQRSELQAVRAQ